jgi:hypothetical protein
MKIVRFDDWATGLLIDGPRGPQVLDIAKQPGCLAFS